MPSGWAPRTAYLTDPSWMGSTPTQIRPLAVQRPRRISRSFDRLKNAEIVGDRLVVVVGSEATVFPTAASVGVPPLGVDGE
jgi:hypothetical protein